MFHDQSISAVDGDPELTLSNIRVLTVEPENRSDSHFVSEIYIYKAPCSFQ